MLFNIVRYGILMKRVPNGGDFGFDVDYNAEGACRGDHDTS